MHESEAIVRRALRKAGLLSASCAVWPRALFETPASAAENENEAAGVLGRRALLKGLDGMSRVAEKGNVFGGGHNAAGVMAAAFFCREQIRDEGTRRVILGYVDTHLLSKPM
jgi:hypothetical protein